MSEPRPRVVAVLLAAGAARRYGRAKQTEVFSDGQTLVRGAAEAALAVTEDVIVVTGGHAEAVEAALADLPLRVLRCEDWALGMGHSIACAFRALLKQEPADCPDAVLLCLADQPLVREPQLRRLLEAATSAPGKIMIADYGDSQRGPPAVLPKRFYAALAELTGDEGARSVIRKHAGDVMAVAMPEAALDIDTPDDYSRATNRRAQ